MELRDIAVDRYHLRVTTWGESADRNAVVLAGLSADWHALAPQIRELRRQGWAVHAIALPGFGLPPGLRTEDATFPKLADQVGRAIEALGIERPLIVGHSLGGGVALRLALNRPDLVRGLVLVAPAGIGRSLHWIYKLYCIPLVGRALLQPGRVLRESSIRRYVIGAARRNDARFVAMLMRHCSSAYDCALSTRAVVWANQPRRWTKARTMFFPGGEQSGFRIDGPLEALAGIPMLVLWGDQDSVICVNDSKRLATLPKAQVSIAHGVGHSLPLEVPAWANERVARFVAQLEDPISRAA